MEPCRRETTFVGASQPRIPIEQHPGGTDCLAGARNRGTQGSFPVASWAVRLVLYQLTRMYERYHSNGFEAEPSPTVATRRCPCHVFDDLWSRFRVQARCRVWQGAQWTSGNRCEDKGKKWPWREARGQPPTCVLSAQILGNFFGPHHWLTPVKRGNLLFVCHLIMFRISWWTVHYDSVGYSRNMFLVV